MHTHTHTHITCTSHTHTYAHKHHIKQDLDALLYELHPFGILSSRGILSSMSNLSHYQSALFQLTNTTAHLCGNLLCTLLAFPSLALSHHLPTPTAANENEHSLKSISSIDSLHRNAVRVWLKMPFVRENVHLLVNASGIPSIGQRYVCMCVCVDVCMCVC